MELVGNIYLVILLPLISSLLCYLVFKKIIAFGISLSCLLAIFGLLANSAKEVFFYEKILVNPASSLFSSIVLDFKIDIVSLIFLLLIIFVKIIFLVFSYKKITNKPFEKAFYATYLINVFGIIGVCLSSNLLNLLIFLEIYSVSFVAIILMIKNQILLEKTIKYFYVNAVTSLILLLCFFVFFFSFNSFNFSQISLNSSLLLKDYSRFLMVIFALIFSSIFFKLIPFSLYVAILKTRKLIAQYLLPKIILTKSILLIFLVIKFYSFFCYNGRFFIDNFIVSTFVILAVLFSFYCSCWLFIQKKPKAIALNIMLVNISLMFLAISAQEFQAYQLLFFYLLNFVATIPAIFCLINFVKTLKFSAKFVQILVSVAILLIINLGFFANIYFAYSLLEFDFRIIILPALIFANIAQFMANINLAKSLFSDLEKSENSKKITKNTIFNLKSFWHNLNYLLVIFMTLLSLLLLCFLPFLYEVSLKFSAYLLTNVI